MSNCNCFLGQNPTGTATNYKMVISGISNNLCGQCSQLNGTYFLPSGSPCNFGIQFNICSFTGWSLKFENDANNKVKATLTLGGPNFTWTQSGLPDCWQVMTLTGSPSNPACNGMPTSITVTPVPLTTAEQAAAAACIPALTVGNGPGSNLAINLPPFQGQPFDGHADPLGITEVVGGNWLAPLAVLTTPTCGPAAGCGCATCQGGGGQSGGGAGASVAAAAAEKPVAESRRARVPAAAVPTATPSFPK